MIVVVSGYFDPLHVGHIELLRLSHGLGRLIVILNNDQQAKLKKGYSFMTVYDRQKILEELRCVDEVYISIDTDRSVCRSLKELDRLYGVDVFANGGDRRTGEVPELDVCNELGIKLVEGMGQKIRSSSRLVREYETKIQTK